ncbi:MAG: S-adenosylmethionine:tRNA ribosyltransferase-isomerase [Elusimicrobiota bacterium]
METNFNIPAGKIALKPASPRHTSKLMLIKLPSLETEHLIFRDIYDILEKGCAVAVNDSKVINARLKGKKSTGGRAEFLLLSFKDGLWEALGKPASRIKEKSVIQINSPRGKNTEVRIEKKKEGGRFLLSAPENILDFGHVPLPPYIVSKRPGVPEDEEDYRSVFSEYPGSVASATASLHFSRELKNSLIQKGVSFVPLTLHVGPGTFMGEYREPSREEYKLSPDSADKIENASRLLVCGTTSMRVLESCFHKGKLRPSEGSTGLYIKPGYKFKKRDMFLTNFHLPQTPLIDLVSAYIDEKLPGEGRKVLKHIYCRAAEKDYRFLSYGDAMLFTNEKNEH